MDIKDFKAATARLFFDMINADGVIEDNEILLLEGLGEYTPVDKEGKSVDLPDFTKEANEIIRRGGLRKKYRIERDDIEKSIGITTSQAISILKRWQEEVEPVEVKYDKNYLFRAENVKEDLMAISGCDGSRSIEEAKLLAAVGLCLNNRLSSEFRAIPITYRERNLRFAKKEIVYLEGEYDAEVNEDIIKNKPYIESLLTIYGYEFVYIPDIVKFLRNKAKSGLLTPILMFSKPFYYKDEKKANEFASEIQSITTKDFTETFSTAAHLEEPLPPCLLIKVKTSTIESVDEDNKPKRTKYTDFIALPINGSVAESVRRLPENILDYTDGITSLVTKSLNEKLYCKGIHKTLIDYAVHKSSSNLVNRVVINIQGREKYIEFEGVAGSKVVLQPKEIVLYLLSIIFTAYGKGLYGRKCDGVGIDRMIKAFERIYEIASDGASTELYNKSLSVQKSKIRSKINALKNFEDRDKYNIDDSDGMIRVAVNPDKVFIRETYSDKETPLRDWLIQRNIPL